MINSTSGNLFRTYGFLAVHRPSVALIMFALTAVAQEPAEAPFLTHQLRPNVDYIEGGGGHSGVIIGDSGVIVIDAKTTSAGGKELLQNISRITNKSVNTVILTHSDPDHVNGLASFLLVSP